MEQQQTNIMALQQSLRDLQLETKLDIGGVEPDRVLGGKILSTQVFRQFTISEIVTKIWRIQHPVRVEKANSNMFKFIFGSKRDRDHMFLNRPWSPNDAHLILKPLPENMVIQDISFATTTLLLQIHGMPPAVIHEGTTKRIGNRVGKVHLDKVNRRCVVAHTYLRVWVDVSVQDPLLPKYFYPCGDDELWVQFKFQVRPP